MKLLNLLLISSTALFCNASLAQPVKSAVCPLVSSLKNEKISNALEFRPGLYMAVSESRYKTNQEWRFSMGPLTAKSAKEALRLANATLKNITGPIESNTVNNSIVCSYGTGNPASSAIATPTANE